MVHKTTQKGEMGGWGDGGQGGGGDKTQIVNFSKHTAAGGEVFSTKI